MFIFDTLCVHEKAPLKVTFSVFFLFSRPAECVGSLNSVFSGFPVDINYHREPSKTKIQPPPSCHLFFTNPTEWINLDMFRSHFS